MKKHNLLLPSGILLLLLFNGICRMTKQPLDSVFITLLLFGAAYILDCLFPNNS